MAVVVASQLGLLGLVAMYVAIVMMLMQRPRWRTMLGVRASVGRMPLTIYLMQSLFCTSLFHGWGSPGADGASPPDDAGRARRQILRERGGRGATLPRR
jgi:hypothetical protein